MGCGHLDNQELEIKDMAYPTLLSAIRNAQIISDGCSTTIRITAIEYNYFRFWLLQSILDCEVKKVGGGYELVLNNKLCGIEDSDILAYLIINLLNNLDKERTFTFTSNKDLIKLDIINDKSLFLIINSVINLKARDYMEAYWRTGDRGDYETYHKMVRFEFPYLPSSNSIDLLRKVIPNIQETFNPCVYQWNYQKHEISNGYGRSYSYDDSIDYKDNLVGSLIAQFFDAYKRGERFFEDDLCTAL